jgi:hypothetical protein
MSLAIVSIIVLLILGAALLAAGIYFMFSGRVDVKGDRTEASLKEIISVNVPAQALLIIVGAGFLAFGAWLAVTHTQEAASLVVPPPSNGPSATTSQSSGPSGSPSPIPNQTIKIISPKDGSNVKLNDTIKIQLSGVSRDRYVWLLVQLGSQVYPQGPCNNVSLAITSCPDVRFGDPGMPVGTKYILTAVLVDAQGNSTYMPFVTNGFSEADHPVTPILSSPEITVHGLESG